MIEFVARSGPPEAMNCPALVCDACREQVTEHGNIYWTVRHVDGQRQSSPLFVSHKRPCSKAVERIVEICYPDTEGWSKSLWSEADPFLRQLAYNFSHPFADDPDGEYHDHGLVQPGGLVIPARRRDGR